MIPFPILSSTDVLDPRFYKTFGIAGSTLGLLCEDSDKSFYVMGASGRLGLGAAFTGFVQMDTGVDEAYICNTYGLLRMADSTWKISGISFFDSNTGNAWRDYTSKFSGVGTIKKLIYNITGIYILNDLNEIWGVGYNNYGSFGTGSKGGSTVFIKLPHTDVKDIFTHPNSNDQLYVLKNDNTLWASGYNGYKTMGAIGNSVLSPVQIADNVIGVHPTPANLYIQRTDLSFWCNGGNSSGQLGRGTSGADNEVLEELRIGTGDIKLSRIEVNAYTVHAFSTTGDMYYCGSQNNQYPISFSINSSMGNGSVMTLTKVPGYDNSLTPALNRIIVFSTNAAYYCTDAGIYGCGYTGQDQLIPNYGYNKTIFGFNKLVLPALK